MFSPVAPGDPHPPSSILHLHQRRMSEIPGHHAGPAPLPGSRNFLTGSAPLMPVPINTAVTGMYCLPLGSCLGFSLTAKGSRQGAGPARGHSNAFAGMVGCCHAALWRAWNTPASARASATWWNLLLPEWSVRGNTGEGRQRRQLGFQRIALPGIPGKSEGPAASKPRGLRFKRAKGCPRLNWREKSAPDNSVPLENTRQLGYAIGVGLGGGMTEA